MLSRVLAIIYFECKNLSRFSKSVLVRSICFMMQYTILVLDTTRKWPGRYCVSRIVRAIFRKTWVQVVQGCNKRNYSQASRYYCVLKWYRESLFLHCAIAVSYEYTCHMLHSIRHRNSEPRLQIFRINETIYMHRSGSNDLSDILVYSKRSRIRLAVEVPLFLYCYHFGSFHLLLCWRIS